MDKGYPKADFSLYLLYKKKFLCRIQQYFPQSIPVRHRCHGNIGGMNTKDDPDAYSGEYTKVRDNVFRANTSLAWLLNKSWITNLKFDASVYYNDNNSHSHTFYSSASEQPAVHATQEGYFLASKLPYTYFADQVVDSKELDYAASLKYEWNRRFGTANSNLKAGVQWKATGKCG